MLFLWVFGNNVEDRLGGCASCSSTCWAASRPRRCSRPPTPASDVPNIGASGAIAAVLGGYLLLYPTAAVITLIRSSRVPLPAVVLLVLLVRCCRSSRRSAVPGRQTPGGGVAYFAHVGGFAFGLLTIRWWVRREPLKPAW